MGSTHDELVYIFSIIPVVRVQKLVVIPRARTVNNNDNMCIYDTPMYSNCVIPYIFYYGNKLGKIYTQIIIENYASTSVKKLYSNKTYILDYIENFCMNLF